MTNKEAEERIIAAFAELFRTVAPKDLAELKTINLKGGTREGGNFTGSLQVEKLGNSGYRMKINVEIK